MARIPTEELDELKGSIDLAALVRSKGIELKKHGAKDLCGLSPFTDEKTPSFIVTPNRNLWHCMSSGKGGSVIDFVMQYDGVSFREAVELLRRKSPTLYKSAKPVKVSTVPKLPPPVAFDADDQTLFRQVLNYYAERLKENPSALDYLKKRGLVSEEALKTFRIGYADRTLGLTLPHKNRKDGAEIRARLQKLGLYRDTGREHFNGCLVFPICDENELVQEIYGRKANEKQANKVYHLYLPGPHRGIWNPACLKSPEIILTESVIDALTFWVNGLRNVTCIYGTEGFTDDHLEAFKANQTQQIYLAYDRDKAGDRAAERDASRLGSLGIECFRIKFPPGMDANEYALKVTSAKKSLQTLIIGSEWLGKGHGVRQHGDGKPKVCPKGEESWVPSGQIDEQTVSSKIENSKSHDKPYASSSNNLLAAKLAADLFVDEARQRGDGAPQACPKGEESRVPSGRDDEQLAAKERSDAVPTSVGANVSCSGAEAAKDVPSPKGDKNGFGDSREPDQQSASEPLRAFASSRETSTSLKQSGEDYIIEIIDRQYRVRGLQKNSSFEVLKVNLRLWHNERFYLDTLDFYRAKERNHFVTAAASETNLEPDLVKRDLGRVLLALEEVQEKRIHEELEPQQEEIVIAQPERAAALELLKSPDLLGRILEDFDVCGIVGETTNKLTGYLAAVSRKLDRPLAVIIQSTSAAGKSTLMESILAFIPEEERVKYSAMTGQSLYYLGETNLKNKVLAIVEEEGAEKASYALKLLQSEGELTIASTGKDDQGRMKTEEYHVEGPVMIFLTTTAVDIDEELLNRCLVLTVDESREQTKAIHDLQREAETFEGLKRKVERDRILTIHCNAQRLLKPLHVVNPFAKQLTFLSDRTRTRRDHTKYLTLIRTITLLHQHQRPLKEKDGLHYIEVELADIAAANAIAHEVLGRSLDELPPQTRRLLGLLRQMVARFCEKKAVNQEDCLFTRRQVRAFTGWSNTQLKVHLDRLEDLEYILPHRGMRGSAYEYELLFDGDTGAGEPQLIGLIDLQKLGYDAEFTGWMKEFAGSKRPQNGEITKLSLDAKPPKETAFRSSARNPRNAQEASKIISIVS